MRRPARRFTQCKAIHIWGMEGPSAREAAKGNSTEISGLGDSGLAGTDGECCPPETQYRVGVARIWGTRHWRGKVYDKFWK
jgi:hypothetical protein